ncbi:hypothetical protein AAVH_14787 [Aphelenchoides avenae]|nr:hypothetical protein AAVH_14787 [Aphelenchus avenae]
MTGPTNHHDDKENQLRSGPAGGSPSKNRNSGDSVVVLSGNQSENGGSNESVCVNAGSPFEDRSAELSTDHGMDEADSDVEVVYESIMRRYSDAEIIHEPVQSLKDEASSRSNHDVVNLELPDHGGDYDSDEWMDYGWKDLASSIDFRSEDELTVSSKKDYLEVLEDKLERRIKARKSVRKSKRSRKHKSGRTCNCRLCSGLFKRDHHHDDGASGGAGGFGLAF